MKKVFILIVFLVLTNSFGAFGQDSTRIIRGIVVGDNREGLPGQNIVVKGTVNGTMSDINGEFKLEIPKDKNVVLRISLCFSSIEIETKLTQDFYKIKMSSDKIVFESIYPEFIIGTGTSQFSSSFFQTSNLSFHAGVLMRITGYKKLNLISGLQYNYLNSKIESQSINLQSITMPMSLKYELFRISNIFVYLKAGGFTTYYPFEPKSISIQQKWNYGLTTGVSTYWRGFSLNLDAYFGMNDLEINQIKTQNTTYTATLGIGF
jgi:hypothetical protein